MTETETKWAERVRRWRSSGQTAPEFAQGQGFESSTLRFWASRLKQRPESSSPPAARVPMVRVQRASAPVSHEPMVLAIGSVRVEVRPGFDGALLRKVVRALAVEGES
jgi:hypothetical protein